jgi:integrase/recombinase XerD
MRPTGTGGQAKELSPREITRIMKILEGTAHEHRDRAILWMGLGTGMRVGEIVSLKDSDVLGADGEVFPAIRLEKHSTKSKKSRTVDVHPIARVALAAWITHRNVNYPPNKINGWLFPAARSVGHLSPQGAVVALDQVFDRAGVEHASSHSLRRTHANMLRRNGADFKIIQEQLGHSSLAITERYFVVDPAEKKQAVERMSFDE